MRRRQKDMHDTSAAGGGGGELFFIYFKIKICTSASEGFANSNIKGCQHLAVLRRAPPGKSSPIRGQPR